MLVAGYNRVFIVDENKITATTFLHNVVSRWQDLSTSLPTTYDAIFFSGVDSSKMEQSLPAAYVISREGATKLLKALPLNSSFAHHINSANMTILQHEV
jgi:hypothetical protein